MKRLTSFLFLLAIIGSMTFSDAFSAKRWVLVEEFTNASCGPCAQQNPAFKTFLDNNKANVIPIVYRTSWPGRDIMYSQNPGMYDTRVQYYGVTGVPNARTNGKVHPQTGNWYEGAPGDVTGMQSAVDSYASATSPITITPNYTMTGKTMNVAVNVATTSAISNKKLRTAVVEGYHYYDNAGTNGEKKFYFLVRELLPNVEGESITISANGNQDFSYKYTPNPSFYSQFFYIVSFIQDDATKEVLQAGISEMPNLNGVENMKVLPVTVAVDANQKHGFIEGNSTITRKIKITNPNLKEVTFGLSPKFTAPADWSASINKTEVTLAAGASEEIEASITAGATLSYVSLALDAFAINLPANELGGSATGIVYALHKGTKIVSYMGMAQFDQYLSAVISQSASYKGMTNYLGVLDMEAMSAYPADNFEATVYNFDYFGVQGAKGILGTNYTQSVAIRNNIQKALDAGKDVLIFGEWEAFNTFSNATYANGQTFYKQTIGVTSTAQPTMRIQVNSQGQITGMVPYRVDGVTNDPISGGMSFSCNSHQYATAGQFFAVYTDILKPETGSKAIPFLYADANQSQVVGVRSENAAKGKLVYISAPPSGFALNDLATLYNKIIDWFMTTATAGPKITAAVNSVSFGTIMKGESSKKMVKITNDGDVDLVINSIAIEGDANSVFTLGAGKDTETLGAGASVDIEVIFTPKDKANYAGNLRIQTNAINTPDLKLSISGSGDVDTHVGEIGGKFYLNVSPNPVVSVSNLKYEINNDMPVRLSINLIDAQGNKVAELFNGVSGNGTYNLNLNSTNYAAGAYYLSVMVDGELNNIPVMFVK